MKKLIIILMLTFLCIHANAQRNSTNDQRRAPRERTSISFGGQVEIPVGEYQQAHGEAIYGYGGSFLTTTRFRFIQSGINFTYGQTGRYKDDISFLIGETYNGIPVFDQADLTVKHKVYRANGVLRLKPFRGPIQPYIEGVAGLKNYTSSVKIEQGQGRSSEVIDKYNLERSWTASVGFTAGLKVELSRGLFLEGRYEHLTGGRATYIDPDSFIMNGNQEFSYDVNRSLTSSSLIHLGISLDF